MGARVAKALVEGLKGTQVTAVNLMKNIISASEAECFAKQVADTFLVKIDLEFKETILSAALRLNQDKLVFAPLYMARLYYLKSEEKEKHFNLFKLEENATASEQLKFAGGILMNMWPSPTRRNFKFFTCYEYS